MMMTTKSCWRSDAVERRAPEAFQKTPLILSDFEFFSDSDPFFFFPRFFLIFSPPAQFFSPAAFSSAPPPLPSSCSPATAADSIFSFALLHHHHSSSLSSSSFSLFYPLHPPRLLISPPAQDTISCLSFAPTLTFSRGASGEKEDRDKAPPNVKIHKRQHPDVTALKRSELSSWLELEEERRRMSSVGEERVLRRARISRDLQSLHHADSPSLDPLPPLAALR